LLSLPRTTAQRRACGSYNRYYAIRNPTGSGRPYNGKHPLIALQRCNAAGALRGRSPTGGALLNKVGPHAARAVAPMAASRDFARDSKRPTPWGASSAGRSTRPPWHRRNRRTSSETGRRLRPVGSWPRPALKRGRFLQARGLKQPVSVLKRSSGEERGAGKRPRRRALLTRVRHRSHTPSLKGARLPVSALAGARSLRV